MLNLIPAPSRATGNGQPAGRPRRLTLTHGDIKCQMSNRGPWAALSWRRERAMQSYDAIVIGAGHNGLVAAAYLARAGRRVLVCERDERPGGAVRSDELTLP